MSHPIFQSVFGEQWHRLPPVMQKHYAVIPYNDEVITAEGTLTIRACWLIKRVARLTGILVPYEGNRVPVTVRFYSGQDSADFHFDRIFHYPGKPPYHFHSRMRLLNGNELIERMRFGLGWKLAYEWDGRKVILSHRGYIWQIGAIHFPIPLSWLIGKGYAEEEALSNDMFRMWTHTLHPWFGEMLRYEGEFEILNS